MSFNKGYYVAYSYIKEDGKIGIGYIALKSNFKIKTNQDMQKLIDFIKEDTNYKNVIILNLKRYRITNYRRKQ